ncbi:hypothetical protein ACFE04_000508 [Oxalis oulophora]
MNNISPSLPPTYKYIVNVDSFGAKGDGREDDTQAFTKAWKIACSSKTSAVLVVPKNKFYHVKPILFQGPCKSDLTIKIYGTIKASNRHSDYQQDPRHWIHFENVNNLIVEGGGVINGNGKKWWLKSCKIDKSLAVTFTQCHNLRVANLKFRNAQKMHLAFEKCINVRALNIIIYAPGKSPNTDGIHVTATQNILIKDCVIRTGDDCISIVSGSTNVRASGITCGPGHGISIGSLGAGRAEAKVSNVYVDGATFVGTSNGVRIKSWQGGSGYAKNIRFQNIAMHNVSNPIIIDQYYCDQKIKPCPEQASAVQVSGVVYQNIFGTSASKNAINFNCSRTFPCQGIVLQNINLGLELEEQGRANALCNHVKLSHRGRVAPFCNDG